MARSDDFRLGRKTGGGGSAPRRSGVGRYAILRSAKIKTLGNMGASLQHSFRERDTPNADPGRRDDNTVLEGGADSRAVLAAWRERAPEKIRANAVHGLEYFVGGSPEALRAMSRAEQDAYFQDALDWLRERHGAANILSAIVHRDETTPHMTVMTIPLDAEGRLNARALVGNREKLSAMQTDFAERVGQRHGLERGVQGSRATHERVERVYAHIMDPEAPVALPERHRGAFLGLGGESEEAWRQRASQAATDALRGAWTALHNERRNHEARLGSLRAEIVHERTLREDAGDTERTISSLVDETRQLSRQTTLLRNTVTTLNDRLQTANRQVQDVARTAQLFAHEHGLDARELVDRMNAALRGEQPEHQASRRAERLSPAHDDDEGHG